ncbi:MAG TPA: Crp/Fnr family transcriptional regulator [Acidimicrobiales bacterium]|nr:Crp/Fnr family transcriptional regulator [Acidimicrobiales bacterium]
MSTADLLSRTELFRELVSDALEELVAAAEPRSLSRNEVIFDEGDPSTHLYVVRSGRIAIGNKSVDGRESVVALMGEGDIFGELGFFDGGTRSAGARAIEPSEVISLPNQPVHDILDRNPDVLWRVVAMLARRLRSTDETLADSVFLDVPGRTAKRLLELAGDADTFVLPVTQEELAGMVGASRERVNKAIATFVRLGWLTQSDRKYSITDRPQLELRAR